MKLNFTYSKLGNKFFFISNLTEWHYSCVPEYNKVWLQQTGVLNEKEKWTLKEFKNILKKYKFGNYQKKWRYLGYFFLVLPENQVWGKIKKQVNKEEFKKLKNIFEIFTNRFEKIWKTEEKNIIKAIKILKKELSLKKYKKINKDLKILFGKDLKKEKIKIIILMRPTKVKGLIGGGSANFGKNIITLESSDINKIRKQRLKKMVMVFYHEVIHATLASPKFENEIRSFLKKIDKKEFDKSLIYKKIKSYYTIVNEGITSSLLSPGYLSEKHFNYDLDKKFEERFKRKKPNEKQRGELNSWRLYAAYKLKPLLTNYLKTNKKLDRKYIQEAYRIFLNFNK